MSFITLPLEIHCQIISYLLSNSDVAALSIQCRTLHSICDMASRKRYHQIDISEAELSVDDSFNFLMDILKQPHLALYVRHLKYRVPMSRHSDYKEAEPMRELSSEDMSLIRNAVKMGGFTGPKQDRVVNMLMQRVDYTLNQFGCYRKRESFQTFITQALAAIILAVSPNIVSITTTNPHPRYSAFEFPLYQFLRLENESSGSKRHLCNLRSVYMISKTDSTWEDGRFYIPMKLNTFIKLFDKLPSIESISTDVMEEDENEDPGFKKGSSNVNMISVCHSSVSSTYLAGLMWSCKALKEFRYSIGGRSTNDGGHPIFNAKALIKAMCGHKETIEIIDIDAENDIYVLERNDAEEIERSFNNTGSPYEGGLDDDECKMLRSIWKNSGSMSDFKSLKSLSLGVKLLSYFAKDVSWSSGKMTERVIVANCLPDTLEYLCVRGYEKGKDAEDDEQMNALMAFYKSGQSHLKELWGIEELIPHASYVDNPDEDGHLLWPFEQESDIEDESDSEEEEGEEEQ
ncbi:unnamed protein product [Penicillium salamii]|uniref:F-box domain-containing protein n=1 Tax=Penicillium salamii TaxID=1612424 RepID=A0A9W4IIE5_9EURO|nr:unnamed protein product [Penicillium salamii]CAG8287352.1 unnamed protein product [Penicillium salamii]CAG8420066.1 unnamed protein product [Penicillium salamii]CAG8420600.1 unnamed protein product [Penicillium salamii]